MQASAAVMMASPGSAATGGGEKVASAGTDRWRLEGDEIVWEIARGDDHRDFVEMNGERVALIVRYGVDGAGLFSVNHSLVWPSLRFHPNLTHSHLRMSFGEDNGAEPDPRFAAGSTPALRLWSGASSGDDPEWQPIRPVFTEVRHGVGSLEISGTYDGPGGALAFQRSIFPSATGPMAFDDVRITNRSDAPVRLAVLADDRSVLTPAEMGVSGSYMATRRTLGAGMHTMPAGASIRVSTIFDARPSGQAPPSADPDAEKADRVRRLSSLTDKLRLETPDPVLNAAFAYAKRHATESIFRTKVGPMHSPGGGVSYYAAIWANDQTEYVNPFFAMLGDDLATEAALLSFRLFARFINPEFKPIPSSIIAEGDGTWHGAGDRGDMAMIAYGAGRFALAYGSLDVARELWPLITWCLEYLRRRINARGVVASASDELENRFPSGKANLSTSSLYHDALQSAEHLGRDLDVARGSLADLRRRRHAIRASIERHFGAVVEGYRTYRYFDRKDLVGAKTRRFDRYIDQPDVLRAWIVVPLTMGLTERAEGTIDAMFSERLWTADGLATEAGQTTIWDRTTLYGLRGAFIAGAGERALPYLRSYSRRRLLGDHVPYPFEAFPEGGKAQLAAESGLYCRVFTEGLFGIRPAGLRTLQLTPRLPKDWQQMALRGVHAFGCVFDLVVRRRDRGSVVEVVEPRRVQRLTVDDGGSVTVEL